MERRIHDFLPNIKDYYTINDLGEIYSDNTGLMKTRNKKQSNYKLINFQQVDGTKKTYRVHRLVMMAFAPIENMDKMEVNHLDGNKENNCLSNLEWCTASENQLHAFKTGLNKPRIGEKNNFAKLSYQNVQKVFELREQGLTQREIANIVHCTRSNISYILSRKTWQV